MKIRLVTIKKSRLLLPEHFPHSVTQNYWPYTRWNIIQYISSSMVGVLSTQQLLLALGYSSPSGVLTSAAALNWVLKDGLGQLGGVLYAGAVGKKFDANTRYYKWIATLSLNGACALEILSPCVPFLFLPLASLATVSKNISSLAASASRAAIHLNFCKENNLGDVTVKGGTQATLSSLIGTGVGGFFGYFADNYTTSLALFSVFSVIHLWSCYSGLRYVVMNSLNLQRLAIILQEFDSSQIVLNPEDVSKRESILVNFKARGFSIGEISKNIITQTQHFIVSSDGQGNVSLIFSKDAQIEDVNSGYCEAVSLWLGTKKVISAKELIEAGWDLTRSQLHVSEKVFTLNN